MNEYVIARAFACTVFFSVPKQSPLGHGFRKGGERTAKNAKNAKFKRLLNAQAAVLYLVSSI